MPYWVYILQSDLDGKFYYGVTTQKVEDRLKEHNEGKSFHTKKFRPWKLVWCAGFSNEKKARDFERYLKSGSGSAFSRKHLI